MEASNVAHFKWGPSIHIVIVWDFSVAIPSYTLEPCTLCVSVFRVNSGRFGMAQALHGCTCVISGTQFNCVFKHLV